MKRNRSIALLLLCFVFIISTPSCMVVEKQNSGRHLGWYKTPHNEKVYQRVKPSKNKIFIVKPSKANKNWTSNPGHNKSNGKKGKK